MVTTRDLMECRTSDRTNSQCLTGGHLEFKANSTVFIMMPLYISVFPLPFTLGMVWGCSIGVKMLQRENKLIFKWIDHLRKKLWKV